MLKTLRRTAGMALTAVKLSRLYITDPPAANLWLNNTEISHGRTKLFSYPVIVGINISNICNQQCRFCCQDNSKMRSNNWLTADVFKRMKWLKYVTDIYLFAGGGEPLMNPHFSSVVEAVRGVAPKSRLCLFTNGQDLDGDNLKATLDNIGLLHISLNAVSKRAFDAVVRGDHGKVMSNLENLSRSGRDNTDVELSMILTRHNADEVKPMIDFAHDLGFSRVIACYFIPMSWPGSNIEFGAADALDRECVENRKDEYMEYAAERGVGLVLSLDAIDLTTCMQPWQSAFMGNDYTGDRVFRICCSGLSMNTHVTMDSYIHFKRVWNSPRMREIRRTVNLPEEQQNTMCRVCRTVPRSGTDWIDKRIEAADESEELTVSPSGLLWKDKITI